MRIRVIATGGTIDKVYFDASSEYEVGEPTVPHVFRESGVSLEWRLLPLLRKDSLEMNDDDRAAQVDLLVHGLEGEIASPAASSVARRRAAVLSGAPWCGPPTSWSRSASRCRT